MKLVLAYVRPEQLPSIKQALFDVQIKHFSAMTIMGTAPKTEQHMYRGEEKEVSLFKRVRIECVVKESDVETAIKAISEGSMESGGWGRILVIPVEDMVKIWTGERGNLAY